MKLKEIKCPNCNANISLKENATKGVCEYCNSEFVIDDDSIKIEHSGTIEITNDTSLKIANTTLNQFKDYDKSLKLYKSLIHKYAHKKEVYIGLIRSITRDFTVDTVTDFQLEELNDYWKKYVSLATDKDIAKYEESIKSLNKNYWYTTLIDITNNFNSQVDGENINEIEKCYNSYLAFCDKKEKITLDNKYKKYIADYKLFVNKNKTKRKNIIIAIVSVLFLVILAIIIFLLIESPKRSIDSINLSEINKYGYNGENDYQYFEKYFKDTTSEMTITDIKLNKDEKTVSITVSLKNILVKKTKIIDFNVIDDIGPIIEPVSCSFTDTDTVNVYECFTLYDFTDGEMNVQDAKVDTTDVDFKIAGTKTISVTATDKDGNENKLDIQVTITQTPIQLDFTLSDKLIVGNTYNISYNVTPNNVIDTSVSYTYDKNLISISNGKITPLKKGKTDVCAISNYNTNIKQCKTVTLEIQCRDTYTFNFDGSKKETIVSDEVFCPGTYRIYASVMNRDEIYSLEIKPKDEFVGEHLTVYKESSFINDEGRQYVLTSGYTITTEVGITQVKLVKQK